MNDYQNLFESMLIEDLQLVLKVAEFRSITAAATSLDLHIAAASAAVKRVEAALGVDLFVRSTRSLRLSTAGERYLPHCQQALQMLDLAKQNVKNDLDIVDGELRIGISSDLGRNIVLPWLDEFMHQHPLIRINLNISDSNIDFFRDPVDIALRYGSPKDANLYGFKLCNVPRVLCATPAYLAEHGVPTHPNELSGYNGLFYQLRDSIHTQWEFQQQGTTFKIKMTGNRAGNDGDLVRRWCVAGKGLAIKSSLDMSADLLAGHVVSLLPQFQPTATELWLICPSRQTITPAVRLLRDHLRQKSTDILQQLMAKGMLPETALI